MVPEFASPPVLTLKNGKTSADYLTLGTEPDNGKLCSIIKIRNSGYASFNVLGLSIIIAVGCIIIIANFGLSNVSLGSRGASKLSSSAEKDRSWVHAETLHLQRQMLEERGIGPWERLDRDVPVTKEFGKEFLADPSHDEVILSPTSPVPTESIDVTVYRRVPEQKYGFISIPVRMV
jgi:hypothetical protein